MILLSDLSFRMKDNARTFFLVAIVSTVAFSAIGSLYGLHSFITSSVQQVNPTSISYMDEDGNEEANVSFVDETLQEANIETFKEQITLSYYEVSNESRVLIAKESDYNRFAKLSNEETVK